MPKSQNFRSRIITFFILFFTGIGFGVWSMLIPPEGVISPSVLILIAQIFILAAGVYGVEVHFDIKEGQFHTGQKPENPES